MINNKLFIKGAREHNLKNIDLEIPRDKLVVFTGLSGSGKSSLAFDTIYAEGQRRYVESLSAYARQFLGQMEKPDVDYIEGLSPAISIDQKTTSKNPRSTVGTVTEIHDYLRLLFARIGIPHCPQCGKEIKQQTIDQMVDKIKELGEGTRIQLLAPIIRGRKGEHTKLLEDIMKQGFVRIRIDGLVYDINDDFKIDKNKKHSIEVVVDRIIVKEGIEGRITDSIETVLNLSGGLVIVEIVKTNDNNPSQMNEIIFSQNYACDDCGISIEELTPRMFSFNSPFGACSRCDGLGSLLEIDPDLVIPDKNRSLADGALRVGGWNSAKHDSMTGIYIDAMAKHYGLDIRVPLKELPDDVLNMILYGNDGEKLRIEFDRGYGKNVFYAAFEGVVNNLQRRYKETKSEYIRREIEGYMSNNKCPECNGLRLRKESLAVTIGGMNIAQISHLSVTEAKQFFNNVELNERNKIIAHQVLKEINSRLGFLLDVGLEYLTLSRSAGTLSGGEAQRIRLATQIGSSLVGVLYILDEPSIGLHQRDNARLLKTLKNLRDLGNTLIVVEHDEETIYAADHIVDIGPMAGIHGGEIVATGTAEDIKKHKTSITGQYLSGRKKIKVPENRKLPNGQFIEVIGASENNLKDIDVKIPLGIINCITGVSGSGKSTLINEILYKALARNLNRAKTKSGKHTEIKGMENLEKVINIDQSPIGRTPRSNPATYTSVFDGIRDIFAETQESRMRGYKKGRFSFNVRGGRCEACQGDGIIKIEMHFLPDVYVPCEVCKGQRYNRETLEVRYKGKNISDILDMTVEEALDFFQNIPKLKTKLKTLFDVGLGYIRLGQPSTTLSGGEAQRIKLASELSKRSNGKTMYILDEPTTGLHVADVHRLIKILQRLSKSGNTIVIIEHNLDVIKTCDHVIDLGPEGGDRGGQVVAQGTPEELATIEDSYTGQYLQKVLNQQK